MHKKGNSKKKNKNKNKNNNNKINIILNGTIISQRNLSLNETLNSLRKEMNEELLNSSFLDKNDNIIDFEDENDFKLKEVTKENTIQLKTNNEYDKIINSKKNESFDSTSIHDENTLDTSNEEKKLNLNKIYDFSNIKKDYIEIPNNLYELLEIKNNVKIYKYSNKEPKLYHKLIYQYFYDEFNKEDYDNANIVFFIGKTGDGKTTAINALFNIIKGIKLEYNYRFILINEAKKIKSQAESQTDGLHLYYLKDYNNKPIIIIDSQGFGDTRGKKYDDIINKTFEYVFTYLIDHINIICFIAKGSDERFTPLIKYIFSSATSFFSDDICKNFIFLATHADIYTIDEGPKFIESISYNENFSIMKPNMDEKWWYSVDSRSIFYNKPNELNIYSFEQFNKLYKEKIINSKRKELKKSIEIIKCRNNLKNTVENIILVYKNLVSEKNKIPEMERNINEYQNKINNVDYKIRIKEEQLNNIYYEERFLNNELLSLEREHTDKMSDLDNQFETITTRVLKSSYCGNTYCNSCLKNCHENCDCYGAFMYICSVFPFFGNNCLKCGHSKYSHSIYSYYKYVDQNEKKKIPNYDKKNEENNNYSNKKSNIHNRINRKKYEKDNINREINNLRNEKNSFQNNKNNYINEKKRINNIIIELKENLSLKILDFISYLQIIKNHAMNQNHIKTENEYIDSTIQYLENIGQNSYNQIQFLRKARKNNDIIQKLIKLSEEGINSESFIGRLKDFL